MNASDIRKATPEADVEVSKRCGIANRNKAYSGVWVRFTNDRPKGIFYGSIDGMIEVVEDREHGLHLRFKYDTVNDGSFVVRVTGEAEMLDQVGQELTLSCRSVLRPENGVIGSITVEKVNAD